MKKIRLNLQELKVTTFETSKSNGNSGTVKGFETGLEDCLTAEEVYCNSELCPVSYQITKCSCPHIC